MARLVTRLVVCAGSAAADLGPDPPYLGGELVPAGRVADHPAGHRAPGLVGHLGGDPGPGVCGVHLALLDEAVDAGLERRFDHDHILVAIGGPVTPASQDGALDEDGLVEDDHVVPVRCGHGVGEDLVDGRMGDGVEVGQGVGTGEYLGGQCGTVELGVADDAGPEPGDQLVVGPSADFADLAADAIDVDHGGAELGEDRRSGGLARADAAGQADDAPSRHDAAPSPVRCVAASAGSTKGGVTPSGKGTAKPLRTEDTRQ